MSDKPEWLQTMKKIDYNYALDSDQAMLRSLISVDEAVGDLLKLLEKRQIRENTVVVFMSDNGMSVGEHHIIGKDCPYEECIQIPMVVVDPRSNQAARTESKFALNIDLAPTFLEMAGIPNRAGWTGSAWC